MFVPVKGWRLRSRLQYEFGIPERTGKGDSHLVGPYQVWGRTFYWRYDEAIEDWEVVAPEDHSLADYMNRRVYICTLADEHRDKLPRDELIALLIQACIVTRLDRRADIMDSVEFATMFDAAIIDRVLARHRGKSATQHYWWVDSAKAYHLH
jgi:hypothetical protein